MLLRPVVDMASHALGGGNWAEGGNDRTGALGRAISCGGDGTV